MTAYERLTADLYTLSVTDTDGVTLTFEVNGEKAALGCAKAEFDAPTTSRVVVTAPDGSTRVYV